MEDYMVGGRALRPRSQFQMPGMLSSKRLDTLVWDKSRDLFSSVFGSTRKPKAGKRKLKRAVSKEPRAGSKKGPPQSAKNKKKGKRSRTASPISERPSKKRKKQTEKKPLTGRLSARRDLDPRVVQHVIFIEEPVPHYYGGKGCEILAALQSLYTQNFHGHLRRPIVAMLRCLYDVHAARDYRKCHHMLLRMTESDVWLADMERIERKPNVPKVKEGDPPSEGKQDENESDSSETSANKVHGRIVFNPEDLIGAATYRIHHWRNTSQEYHTSIMEVLLIAIDDERKGLGYGKLLHSVLEAKARQMGCHGIVLGATQDENTLRFYERLGYKPSEFTDNKLLTMLDTKPLYLDFFKKDGIEKTPDSCNRDDIKSLAFHQMDIDQLCIKQINNVKHLPHEKLSPKPKLRVAKYIFGMDKNFTSEEGASRLRAKAYPELSA